MTMIITLESLIERLRIDTIGNPVWVENKSVFEYPTNSIEVACILKLIRSAQILYSMKLLCGKGLFVDLGVLYRCLSDCVSEIYFMLEKYPEISSTVEQFLKEFFSRTIDNHNISKESSVETKKIHSAMIRTLTKTQDSKNLDRLKRIYKTFSGYVHASYAHIMQMYGGNKDSMSFNISGTPSDLEKLKNYALCDEALKSVFYVLVFVAKTFNKTEIEKEAYQYSMKL